MNMQFLNPRTDFAFKKIFSSAQSKDILLSFLNAILNLESPYKLMDITVLDPYQAPKISGLKSSFLDIKAQDQTGRFYIIEMQVLNVESFEKRILYNACKTYANQINSGEDYHLLSDVIAITITNFTMFPQRSEMISHFKLRADDGDIYNDDLQLVFAELPKLDKNEAQLISIIDKWLYFLKHADDLSLIPESLSEIPEIKQAFAIANRASWTQKELDEQERYEITIQDQRGAISLAEKKGKAEGRMEGIAEGRMEGIAEGRMEGIAIGKAAGIAEGIAQARLVQQQQRQQQIINSAKEMQKLGMSNTDIARINGITEAQLNDLLN